MQLRFGKVLQLFNSLVAPVQTFPRVHVHFISVVDRERTCFDEGFGNTVGCFRFAVGLCLFRPL